MSLTSGDALFYVFSLPAKQGYVKSEPEEFSGAGKRQVLKDYALTSPHLFSLKHKFLERKQNRENPDLTKH